RKEASHTLGQRFVATARRNWRKRAIADSSGKSMSYGESLIASMLLQRSIEQQLDEQQQVGVLLPPSTAGALSNIALTMAGRVPINLNYSSSIASVESALAQAGVTRIISSRKFLEKLGWQSLPGQVICLEDIKPDPSISELARTWLAARLAPIASLASGADGPDQLATVIFSSGSTSEPKGVMLSHANILSNIDALNMLFSVAPQDNMCGVLPFFHSFGFTGTLWFPLLSGFSAVYHPTPLDSKRIVAAIKQHHSSFLLATPTFLGSYLRKASKEDFASLRVVISGAEKLGVKLAEDFQRKFGLPLLEGYGATELSPVAAISLPDVAVANVQQKGSASQSVGRPLPGVAVRIVDLDDGSLVAAGESGMIQICGPNVMLGYLGQAEKTAEVLQDGWYATGDVGSLDEKGFLRITGRLSRFSKIAGEMVPHGAIEEALVRELDSDETVVAVTAVPDSKKGERIVVIYRSAIAGIEKLSAIMDNSNLPNLWKPSVDSYIEVDEIPLLGSGKLDLRAIRAIADGTLSESSLSPV
ncbi:MAG: AMP-binding protein, partial [Desulfuromonadales bacterium]|nr:AMP-binding protein [Desulfuromonadales bacterium]